MSVATRRSTGTLVVGAGQAGLQIATSLRLRGYRDPVLLVGSEPQLPYQRPPLSKGYLTGSSPVNGLELRSRDWYADNAVEVVNGDKVVRLELDVSGRSGSGRALLASGQVTTFDRLALAVGGRPRRLDVPGIGLAGVCYLRTVHHAGVLRRRLSEARHVVVIGGGFIGLEVAATAAALDKETTVVEVADRLLARSVAPVVSEFFRQAHERRGVHVSLGVGVAAIHGTDGRVTGVELTDGSILPADLVLVGIGLAPRTDLAEQLGLDVNHGIVVDARARTSNPAVVAAGDCTVMPHPVDGQGHVRVESVQNAVFQGRVAAASLLGQVEEVQAVPWFWSDQADLKFQIAGLNAGYDEVIVRGELATERFSALYFRAGRLIAADCVNTPRDYMVVRKALETRRTVSPQAAADVTAPLQDLLMLTRPELTAPMQ